MTKRFSDIGTIGRSRLVPWKPGEAAMDRHHRRLKAAAADEQIARGVLDSMDLLLHVSNEGHHWTVLNREVFCEWWPSSAKLVFDRKYRRGLHCHDWTLMVKEIVQRGMNKKK